MLFRSPLIGVLGLIEKKPLHPQKASTGNLLVMIGETKDELGGSEYYEYIHHLIGGVCPSVDLRSSKVNMQAVLELINQGLVNCVHDCSKGGLGVAISEICIANQLGCVADMDKIPARKLKSDGLVFSESHSRYILAVDPKNIKKVRHLLDRLGVLHGVIGKFSGSIIKFRNKAKTIANLRVDKAQEKWLNSLGLLVAHG